MEINHEERRRRYEDAMKQGARQYADVLERLNAEGLPAIFTQTGGMNAALEVQLETGRTLLITDAEDSLSWVRAEQHGWGVGLYEAGERASEGASAFVSAEDSDLETLMQLVSQLLLPGRR